MRSVALALVAIVFAVAAAVTALLIVFDELVTAAGPRLALVAVAMVIVLPGFILLTSVLRRRTRDCTIFFGDEALRLTVGESCAVVDYRRVEHLLWRTRGDYARIEIRAPGVDVSLVVGLATPAPARSVRLPPLPRRVLRRLTAAGLVERMPQRDDVIRFRRGSSLRREVAAS